LKALKVAKVLDRGKDGLNFSQEGSIDGLGEPFMPFFDIFGIC
jgi:hypothetical protein